MIIISHVTIFSDNVGNTEFTRNQNFHSSKFKIAYIYNRFKNNKKKIRHQIKFCKYCISNIIKLVTTGLDKSMCRNWRYSIKITQYLKHP